MGSDGEVLNGNGWTITEDEAGVFEYDGANAVISCTTGSSGANYQNSILLNGDLRSLGTRFYFNISMFAWTNAYNNNANCYLYLMNGTSNTTLLATVGITDLTDDISSMLTVHYWCEFIGDNLNIKRRYIWNDDEAATMSVVTNNTNVNVSAYTSVSLKMRTDNDNDNNSYAETRTQVRMSPIIFTKELIGSNGEE